MNAGLSNLDGLKRHLLAASLQGELRFNQVIQDIGLGVAALFENYCNRQFGRVAGEVAVFQADRTSFVLPRYPVEEVSKVEVKYADADGWVEQASDFVTATSPLSGLVYLAEGRDPARYWSQVRFTYTGGYWFEALEPDDDGYPATVPAGARALPHDLRLAWLLQCREVWNKVDKLGTGMVDKPNQQTILDALELSPMVVKTLNNYQVMQPIVRMDVEITLSAEARGKLGRLGNPAGMLGAMAREMDRQNQFTVGLIMRKRLTGQGPFPVAEHRVGVRTGRLRGAAWATPATVSGATIVSHIGDNVKYARVHEFGGVVKVPEHQRTLRFKTELVRGRKEIRDKRGQVVQEYQADARRLAKQGPGGRLWVFAKARDKNAEEAKVTVKAYQVTVPARAPFRTGIEERGDEVGKALGRAASNFVKKG